MLAQSHRPLLAAAVIMGIVYTAYYFPQNYSDAACLKSLFTNVYLWLAVLALLGCGKVHWDRTTPFTRYMAGASFGLYVVHYSIALYTCYALRFLTQLPAWLSYLLAIAVVLLLSPAAYEGLRRIPVLRFLLFGIKRRRN